MLVIDNPKMIFESESQKMAHEVLGKIDKIRVGHNYFIQAHQGIMECIRASVYVREPTGCMLLGAGGTGKTSIAKIIEQSMPPEIIRENDLETSLVPAFYTSFKSARTLDALTTDVLKKLGDLNPDAGKLGDKASRALTLMRQCRTKIVFIDELHDLDGFEEGDLTKMRVLLKWVKEICNECGPVVCLMGTENCRDLFDKDLEMARRFKHKFLLHQLSVGTIEKQGPLSSFLQSFCNEITQRTQVESFPPLNNYLHALQVYVSTQGNPDFIVSLIKNAVLRALLNERQKVSIDDLSEVWASGLLDAVSMFKFNPFEASQAEIAKAIRESRL